MKKLLSVLLFATTSICSYAQQQTKMVSISEDQLTEQQKAQLQQQTKMVSISEDQLTEQQKAQLQQQTIKDGLNTATSYAGWGKEFGEAANGGLSALTHQADTFSRTKIGTFTMVMIAYKIMGTDIIQFIVGVPLLIIVIILAIVYYRNKIRIRNIIKKKTEKDDKSVVYEYELYETSSEYDWGWVITTAILIGLCMAIIFA